MRIRRCLLGVGMAVALFASSCLVEGDIFFSPGGNTRNRMLWEVNNCSSAIEVAVYNITDSQLAQALVAKKNAGVGVWIVSDSTEFTNALSQVPYLRASGIPVHILGDSWHLMHNKYAVFDYARMETGSYNWTVQADQSNWENCYFMTDSASVNAYAWNFYNLWVLTHQ